MKEIAHRIDENYSGLSPAQRGIYKIILQRDIKTVSVTVLPHFKQSIGHPFSVTILAPGAYLAAPCYGVPSRLGPLDGRILSH